MFHQATFVTTAQHHRDHLVERAAALTGQRPRALCRRRRARTALVGAVRALPSVAFGLRRG
jgi:hypothetical protein